jgi:fructose-specific phosphotransferase system IIC component
MEAKEYIKGFIMGIIAFTIGAIVVTEVLLPSVANSTVPLLSSPIVGTIAGAGLLMFLIGIFV